MVYCRVLAVKGFPATRGAPGKMEKRRTESRRVPAKVNLFLEVLGRRADGYHEIETIMQTISLFDELSFEATEGGIEIRGFEKEGIPEESNLVSIAARKLQSYAGVSSGCAITGRKGIPVARGLGGGSADAAATLAALNEIWGCSLSAEELYRLAGEIGSDVAFFLTGGTAVCRGRGEQVTPIKCRTELDLVLVVPPFGLATREVYEKLDEKQHLERRESSAMILGLARGEAREVGRALFNRLEEAALALAGGLGEAKRALQACGALGAAVTGSGSAVFGLARDPAVAGAIAKRVAGKGIGEVSVVKTNVRESWMHNFGGNFA
ncbi:MAG: 4-(cytidine 5'-diphospho)-2-C-methyl-D-erythritol kinase [Planctomycetota bacterium]